MADPVVQPVRLVLNFSLEIQDSEHTSWAEVVSGKLFSVQMTIQENHKLVTDGPYRYVCHPRHLSIIVFNAGLSLIFRS